LLEFGVEIHIGLGGLRWEGDRGREKRGFFERRGREGYAKGAEGRERIQKEKNKEKKKEKKSNLKIKKIANSFNLNLYAGQLDCI
jgi:hypothetical protein